MAALPRSFASRVWHSSGLAVAPTRCRLLVTSVSTSPSSSLKVSVVGFPQKTRAFSCPTATNKLSRSGSVQQYSTAGSPSSSSKNDNDSGKRKRLLYSQASQEHKPEVMELLCDSFVNREPIGCGVCITKTDFLSWAPRVLDELTAQGFSAVAQDAVTGQVVGFTLNEVETPNSKHGLAYSTQWCQNEKMNVIFKFLGDLDDKAKPYEFFKVDKLFRFQMMGVHEKYGNLGIGRNLKDWAIRTAIKSSDCEVGVVEATGRFSQSINASYGFQVFAEIPYAEYKGEDGKSVFDLSRMSGHLSCKFMAKELL